MSVFALPVGFEPTLLLLHLPSPANSAFLRRGTSTSFLRRILETHGSITNKLVEAISVVFAPDFEVAFWVVADWAFFRCFTAFRNVAAVSAFPFDGSVFLEDFALLYVCQ